MELRSPGNSDHAATLNNLAYNLRDRFLNFGANGDLDEVISLHCSALDLCLPVHSNWLDSLHWLALCFSDRYDKQGTVADLEEAITLSRAALELCSPGHSDRAVTLNNLANYLRSRFLKLGADGDLDEAILLHHSVLDLHLPCHSDQSDSLHVLALCCGPVVINPNTNVNGLDLDAFRNVCRVWVGGHLVGKDVVLAVLTTAVQSIPEAPMMQPNAQYSTPPSGVMYTPTIMKSCLVSLRER